MGAMQSLHLGRIGLAFLTSSSRTVAGFSGWDPECRANEEMLNQRPL